jgi:hypothetical protein
MERLEARLETALGDFDASAAFGALGLCRCEVANLAATLSMMPHTEQLLARLASMVRKIAQGEQAPSRLVLLANDALVIASVAPSDELVRRRFRRHRCLRVKSRRTGRIMESFLAIRKH